MVHVMFSRRIKQKKYGCALLEFREEFVDCKFFVAVFNHCLIILATPMLAKDVGDEICWRQL